MVEYRHREKQRGNMQMIKNIIFDMGQVLIKWSPELLIGRLGVSAQDGKLLKAEVFGGVEWTAMDRGRLSAQEGLAQICRRLPERLHAAARALVLDWWKGELVPMDGMAELIGELKGRGYGIYLLSNATSTLHSYFDRIPGSEHFDGKIVSADEVLLKPQHEIYERLYSRYALRPEECLFIDDSPANVDGAQCTGMDAIVFRGEVQILRRELNVKGNAVKA